MSNPLSKVCSTVIPGDLYQTAINAEHLAVDSRIGNKVLLTVFDLKSGEIREQLSPKEIDPWHSLIGIHGDKLFLQYFENKKNPDLVSYLSLNWKSGKLSQSNPQMEYFSVRTPVWIPATDKGFSSIRQFLAKDVVLGCEYLEVKNLVILSYYLGTDSSYKRFIMVLIDGKEKLHINQDEDLKGFAPGSFFTTENRLIFACQKNEINIYEI